MPILTSEERIGGLLADRYRLSAVLGTGGMGVLFRGQDESTGESVAIKMLKPAHSLEPDRVARFLRETRLMAKLRHPNIARILDSGADCTQNPFLVMELLEGVSLEQELANRGVLPFTEVLRIAIPIATALSAAHSRGIIHRDVKPSNIFLCRDKDGSIVPKLLDFGIAKGKRDDFETHTGAFVGTPGYMAPEQARDGECDASTDVWGMGAVIYRSVIGHPPHAADSVPEVLVKLVREPVPAFVAPGVKKRICAVIDRALERDPQRRYRTMEAFVHALEEDSSQRADDRPSYQTLDLTTGTFELSRVGLEPDSRVATRSIAARSWQLVLYIASIAILAAVVLLVTFLPRSHKAEVYAPVHTKVRQSPRTVMPKSEQMPVTVTENRAIQTPDGRTNEAKQPTLPRDVPRHRQRPAQSLTASGEHNKPVQATPSAPAAGPEPERITGLPVATEW